MKYVKTVDTNKPENLRDYQIGQWVSYNGAKGRFVGYNGRSLWIAWGTTATKRFRQFVNAYKQYA